MTNESSPLPIPPLKFIDEVRSGFHEGQASSPIENFLLGAVVAYQKLSSTEKGPIWVKASDRKPRMDGWVYLKFPNDNPAVIYYHNKDNYLPEACEWLDESPSQPSAGMGVKLIAIERREQIEKHGRTIEKDVEFNTSYQLVHAASRLSWSPEDEGFDLIRDAPFIPTGWSKEIWHKMMDKSYEQRLVIAGALLAAEIDRLSSTHNEKAE